MDQMAMPGGTMSMRGTRMPGQSWPGTATSFLVMWVAMMVAMMLPSLVPTLWRYRACVRRTGAAHADRLAALVGAGYFLVWAATGAIVFPFGVAVTCLVSPQHTLARVAPIVAGAAVLLAGALQHSAWKARRLAVCRESPLHVHVLATRARSAWWHGVRLGVHCVGSCAGLTAVGLLAGAMDLRVMAVVTAAITAERLAPSDARVVRAIGDVVVAAGLVLLARAVGLGGQGL
jgi:predicted metal-binding membrane protein